MVGNSVDPAAAASEIFGRRLELRLYVVPRRDGASGGRPEGPPPAHPDPVAEHARLLAAAGPDFERVLKHDDTADDLRTAAQKPEFGDLELMSPLQAAIAAAALIGADPKGFDTAVVADAWVAACGPAFAAAAAVHLAATVVGSFRIQDQTLSLRSAAGDRAQPGQEERFDVAARVRRHLATVSDADHRIAARLAGSLIEPAGPDRPAAIAHAGAHHRAAVCFLFPERTDLFDDLVRTSVPYHSLAAWFLLAAATTGDRAAALARVTAPELLRENAAATATFFATVGPDLVPALERWIEDNWSVEERLRLLKLLAGLDSDAAMRAILGNLEVRGSNGALLDAAAAFPERGIRLLSEELPQAPASRAAVERVLRLHVIAYPDAAREVAPTLGAEARARVGKLLDGLKKVPEAEPGTLPDLLVSPPWEHERPTAKPAVVKGLTVPAEHAMAWLDDGEQERWLADTLQPADGEPDWDRLMRELRNRRTWRMLAIAVVRGPEPVAREALALGEEGHPWDARTWARAAAARFGLEALPAVLNAVRTNTTENAVLILPFACSEIAPLAADWNARLKTVRPSGQAWLRRHPGVAARALVPAAVGKPGRARQAAEAALRYLVAQGHEAEVLTAAAGHGTEAEAAVTAMLAMEPEAAALPKTMPEVPTWAEPQNLPQLLLAGCETALPAPAVRAVVQMLTISTPDAPYPGLETVEACCDRRSLAAFTWALFENWQVAGHPAKQVFAFDALRRFGDDDTVRRLSPLIRAWPGAGGHARAVAGLDVLAAIGGDTALIHLYGISQKVKFKGLKSAAQDRIAAIADDMRLSQEQLADRLVPDLGLDAAGALSLDYGPRRFTVFFDEQLRPGVVDEAGKRLRSLPKPGAKDDAELAPAAYQLFGGLKKDVRTLAADQIARLERSMVTRRRWTRAEFEEYLVGHPLLRHLVRRLVWADFDRDTGTVGTAFRVAEDLSYADVADDPFIPPADTVIGVAHPADLGADLTVWSEVFADYEILQPFDQLGRPVLALTPEEAAGTTLTRFDGLKTSGGRVLSMERRGWRRSDPADAGWQGHLLRDLPGGLTVVVDLEPGFSAGWVNPAEEQSFRGVWIAVTENRTGYWGHYVKDGKPFSVLDPVSASEVLRDLTEVTAG